MEVTFIHSISIIFTVFLVIGCGIYAARSVNSAEGFSLSGRSAGVKLIAGSIAGTCIGGGATVGTAQMAYTMGVSALWFTLGMGIGLILLGVFYAKPLRNSALETISQYLVLNYGKGAGPVVSIISSLGIFFSCVASMLPGIQLMSALTGTAPIWSAALLMLLVSAYVYFGGMKGSGVSGFLKFVIIWISLFIAGTTAFLDLRAMPALPDIFAEAHWFNLFSGGIEKSLSNLIALIVGVICTQTYIQALFSASDAKTASMGAFVGAAVTIPLGIPSIVIALFMRAQHPDILPILTLPAYLLQYQPPILGGIGLAGILLSLIGSIAGLALGIGTMFSKDIMSDLFKVKSSGTILWVNRITILVVAFGAALVSITHLKSQVLDWNYMSMALRGAGIFLPLSLAVFKPHCLPPKWAVASMLLSTGIAMISKNVLHISWEPLFVGLVASLVTIFVGIIIRYLGYKMMYSKQK